MRPERDLLLRRPLCGGLKELIRRLVFLSTDRRISCELPERSEPDETDLLSRFPSFCVSCDTFLPFSSIAFGGGDLERERLVDIVETESDEYADRERLREDLVGLRSSSLFARISSATPFLLSY
jgi:hypothetical protein